MNRFVSYQNPLLVYQHIPIAAARTQSTDKNPGAGDWVAVGVGATTSAIASGEVCPEVTVVVVE